MSQVGQSPLHSPGTETDSAITTPAMSDRNNFEAIDISKESLGATSGGFSSVSGVDDFEDEFEADGCESSPPLRALCVESHVVHGYVGNRCAVFALQLMGVDVDFINTVSLSSHTSYEYRRGEAMSGSQFMTLIEGLRLNGLMKGYRCALTGYIGTQSFLQEVVSVIKELRALNNDLLYTCDPVLGDAGKLYVPPELVDVYKHNVIPYADLITPNQFEAEKLTGIAIRTLEDADRAAEVFHSMGVRYVCISSVELASTADLTLFGSEKKGETTTQFTITFPKIDMYFTGAGDLFAASVTGWTLHEPFSVACEKAIACTQAVLRRTHRGFLSLPESERVALQDPQNRSQAFAARELRVVQSQNDIRTPRVRHQAKPWTFTSSTKAE